MKLIRILSNNDSYTVHAASSVKFLGLRLFSKITAYERQKDSSTWYQVPQSSKVSGEKEKKLNKWISDHEKYVLSPNKE